MSLFTNRYILALLVGAAATLALPPTYLFPLLIPAFSLLLLLIDNAESKLKAFFIGWCFGFGHHVTGLYWIANSLLVDAERFAWLIPFAVSLIPAALAVYIGLVALITFIFPGKGILKVLFFASIWLIAEILRAYLFTGFPWNLIGYSWAASDEMAQLASVIGVYGLSFLTIIVSCCLYPLVKKDGSSNYIANLKLSGLLFIVTAVTIVAASWFYGNSRINNTQQPQSQEALNVHVIQPNIQQKQKWLSEERINIVAKHINLTKQALAANYNSKEKNLVVWSETSVPYVITNTNKLTKFISQAIPENTILVTGALRAESLENNSRIYNSMFFLGPKGEVLDYYDKFHLVPFGEYVPLKEYLWFIDKITYDMGEFGRGSGNKTVSLFDGSLKVSPLICYEVIFPNHVSDEQNPPDILLNITNDAWFGDSKGPHQHLATARMRAIEEGTPLIRVANTGISAVFDHYGREIARIGLNKESYFVIKLQRNKIETIYGEHKTSIILLIVTFPLIISVFFHKKSIF